MKTNKFTALWLLFSFAITGCGGESAPTEPELPFYQRVWQSDNYTLKAYNIDNELISSIKVNEFGADLNGTKSWFYSGYALTVYQDESSHKYLVYETEMYGTYYNCMTEAVFKTLYEFKEAAKDTSFDKVNGYEDVYVTMPGKGGVDYLARRFASLYFNADNYNAIIETFKDFALVFTVAKDSVSGYLITDRKNAGGQFSYWISFEISDVGSTDIGFTPEIIFVNGRPTESTDE